MLYSASSAYNLSPLRVVGSPADVMLRQGIAWAAGVGGGNTQSYSAATALHPSASLLLMLVLLAPVLGMFERL